MREIKFRAWDKKKKKMVDVEVLDLNCGDVSDVCVARDRVGINAKVNERTWSAGKDVILMQFTGLKDKNGKEIYEGDIVSHIRFSGEFAEKYHLSTKPDIGAIEWDDELPGFIAKVHYYPGEETFPNNKMEVIGNIYENSELLNPKKI